MKQIEKTPEVLAALRQSVGKDVNLDGLAVYEAIALNNRPIRKEHPLFKGAVADRSLLLEMAAALSQESRPVQIQHLDDDLPSGRAFHGKMIERGSELELRVLFFVQNSDEKIISKLDSGTVDQVSVSILPKKILNSVSGFDYLGPSATAENIWTGDDGEGNKLGRNGVHGRMVGLDKWFELSLVGMGGAENARIVSRDESYFGSSFQKLAASGVDPSLFLLEASTENTDMSDVNLKDLVDKLAELSASVATLTAQVTTLSAEKTALEAKVTDLTEKLDAAENPSEALTAAQTELTETKDKLTASEKTASDALVLLKDIAKKVLTATGKPDQAVPESVDELNTLIADNATKLVAALAAGGKSKDAVDDIEDKPVATLAVFRTNRKRA